VERGKVFFSVLASGCRRGARDAAVGFGSSLKMEERKEKKGTKKEWIWPA